MASEVPDTVGSKTEALNGGDLHNQIAPSGVEMPSSTGSNVEGNGILFEERKDGIRNGIKITNSSNVFDRLRLELSNSNINDEQLATSETRPVPHHYMVQRPRALQYTYKARRIGYGEDANPMQHAQSNTSVDVKYTIEGISISRERIDLFIDLVWVGENRTQEAFLKFILVFMPSWRIWNHLREFLNMYYMDDTIQRLFIFWILLLSVFFGNQIAYFAEDYQRVKVSLVLLYLFIRSSFVIMEIVYSIWIPWLRKLIFVNFLIFLPSTGLWIAVIYTKEAKAAGPAVAAIVWEYLVPFITETPLGERLLPGEYRKEIDPIHLRGRMGNFLIITIGEGVLQLVRAGPLGIGITPVSTLAIFSLQSYFILAYLYFARDQSVRYIPAVRHKGWRMMAWLFCHVPIFASYITLSSGILWFINRNSNVPDDSAQPVELTEEEFLQLRRRALWDIGTSYAIIVFCYLCQALLDKPLDPPNTMMINNRHVRLIGRPIFIIVILSILVVKDMNAYVYLGVCGTGLFCLLLYEMIGSLERPFRFAEPRGLTVLMKKEYRQPVPEAAEGVRIAI